MADQDVDIRLPQAQQDATNAKLDPAFLPGGSPNGNPIDRRCFNFPGNVSIGLLPHQLEQLSRLVSSDRPPMPMGAASDSAPAESADSTTSAKRGHGEHGVEHGGVHDREQNVTRPVESRLLHMGDFAFELNEKLTAISKFCFKTFRTPPSKALYLQLYHEFANIGMCVNGRKYLGNTPTVLAGPSSKMKFGVVGMGSMAHTFHIHGHRWLIPGPGAKGAAGLQFGSPVDTPVSQFEDTRIFGPANSFSFTIEEGNGFMRASPPIGEWHMHCHVLAHMMDGMMGSLLIVNGGESATFPLPSGQPCPTMPLNTGPQPPPDGGSGPKTITVNIVDFQHNPDPVNIKVGDTVHWVWQGNQHSTTSDTNIWDSGVHNSGHTFDHTFNSAGNFPYHCSFHGPSMHGTVQVTT